jgi:hypothetical protein
MRMSNIFVELLYYVRYYVITYFPRYYIEMPCVCALLLSVQAIPNKTDRFKCYNINNRPDKRV